MKVLDVLTAPWAIVPSRLVELTNIYLRHSRGERLSAEQLAFKIGLPKPEEHAGPEVVDGVAVISIDGVMAKKMNLFHRISGGTSTELIARDFKDALADPGVDSILLRIDSPGGSVDGTAELAALIYQSRGQKPIVAHTDGMMCSAAYWVGSAADKLFISSETTEVGSIGVVATHVDVSRAEEMDGVKTTEVTAGKYKRVASSYAPLSDIGRATIQDHVDHVYTAFVSDVAKHRGVSAEEALERMADGRIFVGRQALRAGLVDGERMVDDVMRELRGGLITQEGKMAKKVEVQEPVTASSLADLFPDAAEQLRAEGYAKGKQDGMVEGASTERDRIRAVEAQALPGHEALIATLKYDGKSSGAEAAVQVLQAERVSRKQVVEALHSEAPKAVLAAEPPAPAKPDDDQDAQVDRLVRQCMETDKLEYREALKKVSKDRPELFGRRVAR